jgi:hypothetical protein
MGFKEIYQEELMAFDNTKDSTLDAMNMCEEKSNHFRDLTSKHLIEEASDTKSESYQKLIYEANPETPMELFHLGVRAGVAESVKFKDMDSSIGGTKKSLHKLASQMTLSRLEDMQDVEEIKDLFKDYVELTMAAL